MPSRKLSQKKIDVANSLPSLIVFTRWNAFKVCLICFYTIPQAFMDLFIFFEKERKHSFDARSEIHFYPQYLQVKALRPMVRLNSEC
jgi:hypothetical protein